MDKPRLSPEAIKALIAAYSNLAQWLDSTPSTGDIVLQEMALKLAEYINEILKTNWKRS